MAGEPEVIMKVAAGKIEGVIAREGATEVREETVEEIDDAGDNIPRAGFDEMGGGGGGGG